jgi:hypothetical protein
VSAKKLKDSYRRVHHWWAGLYAATWREIDDDPNLRREVEILLFQAKDKIEAHFGPRIGKAEMLEIRSVP